MKRYYYFYKIENPKGRIYIGQTTNLDRRKKRYKYLDCKTQTLLYKSLNKYGFHSHKISIEIEGEYSKEDANRIEIELIEKFKSNFSIYPENKGLNLTRGGGSIIGYKFTEEIKLKMSLSHKGKKMPEKTKEALLKANLGKKKSYKKQNLSDEQRENLRNRMLGNKLMVGRKLSKETIEKCVSKKLKPINQFSIDGIFIKTWPSTKAAAEHLKIDKSIIAHCLRGKNKTGFGYVWKFNDIKPNNNSALT